MLAAVILHRFFVLRVPVDDATVTKIIDQIVIPAAVHSCSPGESRSTDEKSARPES